MTPLIWLAFVAAAILEVGGDALIRKGLRGSGWAAIAAGCVVLACYGLMVNTVKWDFSKLLGVYVAVFAVVSVFCVCWPSRRRCRPQRGWDWGSSLLAGS